jgi:hypothetical protein
MEASREGKGPKVSVSRLCARGRHWSIFNMKTSLEARQTVPPPFGKWPRLNWFCLLGLPWDGRRVPPGVSDLESVRAAFLRNWGEDRVTSFPSRSIRKNEEGASVLRENCGTGKTVIGAVAVADVLLPGNIDQWPTRGTHADDTALSNALDD